MRTHQHVETNCSKCSQVALQDNYTFTIRRSTIRLRPAGLHCIACADIQASRLQLLKCCQLLNTHSVHLSKLAALHHIACADTPASRTTAQLLSVTKWHCRLAAVGFRWVCSSRLSKPTPVAHTATCLGFDAGVRPPIAQL